MRTFSSQVIFIVSFVIQLLVTNTVMASTLTIDLRQKEQDGFTNIHFNYSHADNTNTSSIFDQGNSTLGITYSEIGSNGFLDTNVNFGITTFSSATVASDESSVKTSFDIRDIFYSGITGSFSFQSMATLSNYVDTADSYLKDNGKFSFEVGPKLSVISFDSRAGTKTTIDFTSGDVSAVPIPAAVWFMGTGILGLVGLSRKKKHHNVS